MPSDDNFITLKGVTSSGEVIPVDIYTKNFVDAYINPFDSSLDSSQKRSLTVDEANALLTATRICITETPANTKKYYYLDSASTDGRTLTFYSGDCKKKLIANISDGTIETSDL